MPANPDAQADYEEITQVVEQKLVPTFETLGKMLKAIDDKATQALEMSQKIVEAMSDAVTGQRKGEFSELLGSKFSADIGPLDSFYSDTMGTKFSDQLIEELLNSGPENPEELISSKIGEAKQKYGKYLGSQAPKEPEAPAAEEKPAEEEPEAPAAVEVEVARKKAPDARDMAGMLGLKLNKA